MVILEFLGWQAKQFKVAKTQEEKAGILAKTMRAAAVEVQRLTDDELKGLQLYCEQVSAMKIINDYATSANAINVLAAEVAKELDQRYINSVPELSQEEVEAMRWVQARGLNKSEKNAAQTP